MEEQPDERDIKACAIYAKQLIRGRGKVGRNFEQAVYYFDIAARGGDVDAMYQLGKCYWRGVGCVMDKSGAMACFENAAQRGHLGAAQRLSKAFAEGKHVPQCDTLATYWALKAGELASLEAHL